MGEMNQAPWNFTGNGYIMLFKFPKSYILDHGFLAERFRNGFYGNVGAIVFADYGTSNMGPYQELFFVPGKIRYQHHKVYTITRNYVSDKEGLENSLGNWGIPKERASFKFDHGKDLDTLQVIQNGVPVIDISIKFSSKGWAFPLWTFFHPLHMIQHCNGKTFHFNLHGKGKGGFAEIMKVDVNPELFPNFAFFKHVAIIRVTDFHLKLPIAKIKEER
jgi:hypothetical protein